MNTSILSSPRCKVTIGAILVTMFLFAFVYAQPAAACQYTPQPGTYQNISVQVAHQMIQRGHHDRILILDVRYQCEYNIGHLYGAVLIPYDQLEARISELQAYKNSEIIVCCKSGYRSQIACEILANHSFTHVYNMEGGILAWINAGYSIYTTYHYATVSVADEEVLMHIEPLLLLQTGPAPCTQNQTCSSGSKGGNVTNFQSTVLEQDEYHTLARLTYDVNGTTFEFTVADTLLWSSKEIRDGYNTTARFTSTEITGENFFAQFYGLMYRVRCVKYNLTIQTVLRPLDSGAYNSSSTLVTCASVDKSGLISLEFVEFNSSVTLSRQYAILGQVAHRIGELYEDSGDKNLTQLAPSYNYMEEEARHLSKLVKEQLQEYDLPIIYTYALMLDDWWSCWWCLFFCVGGYTIACGACCLATVVCCYCTTIYLTMGVHYACDWLCTQWGKCP